MRDRAVRWLPRAEPFPIPEFVTASWLRAHGVKDVHALLSSLRTESAVMDPTSLRAIKATRLSFARSLIRRMTTAGWQISLRFRDIDAEGVGRLIYDIEAEKRCFHFAVAACGGDGIDRAGRFYETQFDFLGSLLDGPFNRQRIDHELDEMVAKVWAGRTDNHSYGWTMANRSVRSFDYVVDRLSSGGQPDPAVLSSNGGYILRNAGWYGNGRHGSRSWQALGPDHPLGLPYHTDVFALYLWRLVGFDVVDAIAVRRNARAAPLDSNLKRMIGIGNSSGMGMVAALVRWPQWLGTFNFTRELALAYVISREEPVEQVRAIRMVTLLRRAADYWAMQPRPPVAEAEDPSRLSAALHALAEQAMQALGNVPPRYLWRTIAEAARRFDSREILEQVNSILIEVEHEFADAASELISTGMHLKREIDPETTVAELRDLIELRYSWALAMDLTKPGARTYFWYRSEENGENRRGERDIDPGVENETFVDVVGAAQSLFTALTQRRGEEHVSEFLFEEPQHGHMVSRVQLAARLPYTEIRGNIIDQNFLPMDGIRFLLATIGLEAAFAHNPRYVRGVFMQGAPLPSDISNHEAHDWIFPTMHGAPAAIGR
jgi:hypothetical protein